MLTLLSLHSFFISFLLHYFPFSIVQCWNAKCISPMRGSACSTPVNQAPCWTRVPTQITQNSIEIQSKFVCVTELSNETRQSLSAQSESMHMSTADG